MENEIIENRVNFTVEHWDVVRWASLACYKSLSEAEAKYNWLVRESKWAHTTAKYRIVRNTVTKEVINGN